MGPDSNNNQLQTEMYKIIREIWILNGYLVILGNSC